MLKAIIAIAAFIWGLPAILMFFAIVSVIVKGEPQEVLQVEATTNACPAPTDKDRRPDGRLTLDYLLQVC